MVLLVMTVERRPWADFWIGEREEAREVRSKIPRAFVVFILEADSTSAPLRASIEVRTTGTWVATLPSVIATIFLSMAAMFVFKVVRRALIAGPSAVAAVVRLTRLRPNARRVEARMVK